MTISEKLRLSGIVPVVVMTSVESAVPTARALKAGGIHVMEITLRTDAALAAIREVREAVPDMLVGAGTVTRIDQAEACREAGAQFIVSPGFSAALVDWCIEQAIPVFPGCVTPSEIMQAVERGLSVLKFFPANIYGGLSAMKALAGPFGDVTFIPTGGVSADNLSEFISSPFVHAVGGSWICSKDDISKGNYDRITQLCRQAIQKMHGFEFAHLGINAASLDDSREVADTLHRLFGFDSKEGNSSIFAGSSVEVMKEPYLGEHGHIAIRTNDVERAVSYLEGKGLQFDPATAKYKDGRMLAVYLKHPVGKFAVHLVRK